MFRCLLCLISFILLGVFVSGAVAATLHVGSGQTYTTIEDAYDAADAGDEIIIHAGVYDGVTMSSDDDKDNLTFRRYGNDKVIWRDRNYIRYKDGFI